VNLRDATRSDLPAIIENHNNSTVPRRTVTADTEPVTVEIEPWAYFPRVAELDGVGRDLVVLGFRLDEEPALG
jgi:hypothetical protein